MTTTTNSLAYPDDFVSDIAVRIGLTLRRHLKDAFPGRLLPRERDNPLSTAPGHTIFVSSNGDVPISDFPWRILPALQRDLTRQLDNAGLTTASPGWGFMYVWDGRGLFPDGTFVRDGFRFDAAVELVVPD